MRFSVVLQLCNNKDCIREALNSVLNQTYAEFEVIVVDRGSTDGSLEIVKEFSDERLLVIEQTSCGASLARNLGIAASCCEWIAFLDGSDVWSCFHLEQLAVLHRMFPQAGVLSTNYLLFSSGEDYIGRLYSLNQDMRRAIVRNYYFRLLGQKHCVWISSTAVRKELIETVKGFNERLIEGAETALWAKLNEQCEIALSEYITTFRRLDHSEDGKKKNECSVKNCEVYYFNPKFWKHCYKSMYQYREIYGYIRCFLVSCQLKNLLLLLLRYNYKLLRIPHYAYEAKQLGIKF